MSRLPLDVERRGEGRPLVLLHGFGASRFTWRFWVDDLARTHRVHLVDLFGFGAAPPPDHGRYGPVAQAEAVVRWMREEDLRGATVIGHSLGGGVALLVALQLADLGESDRLTGLVSVAGPAYPQAIPRYIGLARIPLLGRTLLTTLGAERVARRVLQYILYDPASITDAQVEGYAGPLRQGHTRRALVETARQIVPPGLERLTTRFGEIAQPVLLLWGRHDPVIPLWVADRLAEDLPHARRVVLERCGHVPPEERPEEGLRAVRDFLRDVE